jgi:hypothetical protein
LIPERRVTAGELPPPVYSARVTVAGDSSFSSEEVLKYKITDFTDVSNLLAQWEAKSNSSQKLRSHSTITNSNG